MTNEHPILPREDSYWKRQDEEIVFNATVVLVSIILAVVIICISSCNQVPIPVGV